MPNIVPGALWRPIDVGKRDARRKGRGLIGHIAVVNSTLLIPGPVSTRPSDWHFYLPKNPYPTGERFAQLIDLDLQSWSSGAANATCAAFEAEGGVGADVNGPWTPNQVEGAAMILAHMHRTEGVPLQDMVNSLPGSRGFGVHRYGIDPYRVPGGELWSKSYAKACPGDARVRQIPAIVARAQQLINGSTGSSIVLDNETATQISKIVVNALTTPGVGALDWKGTSNGPQSVVSQMRLDAEGLSAVYAMVAGQNAAIEKLSEAVASGRDDLTADELKAAVAGAIQDAGAALRAAQGPAAQA